MSETTESPEGVTPSEPQPGTGPSGAPAPESTPAPETEPPAEPTPEQQKAETDREGRRLAALRARLGAAEREQARQAAELEFYRRQAAGMPPQQETPEQAAARQRAEVRAEVEADIRKESFHQAGQAAYADWSTKCQALIDMGADPEMARLLVEMPGGEGVKVAAALSDDPSELQRIANLRGERARAIALGKYAASIEDAAPAHRGNGNAPPREVTRAPAPVRPVTGRASPVFNEYSASVDQLAEHYLKQNLERRTQRR